MLHDALVFASLAPVWQPIPSCRPQIVVAVVQALDGLHVLCIQGELPDVKIFTHLGLLESEGHSGDTTLIRPPKTDLSCGYSVLFRYVLQHRILQWKDLVVSLKLAIS